MVDGTCDAASRIETPCRYHHGHDIDDIDDIDVEDSRKPSPYGDGSDHGAVVTDLDTRQP